MEFVVLVAAGYILLVGALYFGQRSLMHHPEPLAPHPRDHAAPEMSPVRIPVAAGLEIYAWWHPPPEPERPVLIYLHGNADHIGDRDYKARIMIDSGFGMLLVTWRYNAGAGGRFSEQALLEDGRAALAFARERGIPGEQIVLYGESLGTGIAVALAAGTDIGALVLETPYSSIADVAQSRYWYTPAKWLTRDRFDAMAHIGAVRAPVLVFHGDADATIPIRFAKRLFEAAPEPKEGHFIPGAGHADLYDYGAGVLVVDFVERHVGRRPGTEPET